MAKYFIHKFQQVRCNKKRLIFSKHKTEAVKKNNVIFQTIKQRQLRKYEEHTFDYLKILYDNKLHLMVRLLLWRSKEYWIHVHCHYF